MTDRKDGVIPHLVVNDATAALQFYEKALGATVTMRVPAQDKKRIMHAEIRVNGAMLYVRDHFPEHGTEAGKHLAPPSVLNGTTVTLHLAVEDCDGAVQRAAAAGARVTMPPMDAFWGERFAQIEDPFGHGWSFAHPLRKG